MKTDAEIKADVMERIDSIPSVQSTDIEVFVDQGMVTLNGAVDSHQTRFQVERSARRVAGIRGLKVNLQPVQATAKRNAR